MPSHRRLLARSLHFVACALVVSSPAFAQELQPFLRDRGTGVSTSMFGTYVDRGQLLLYPFFEYTAQNLEYKPSEMGYGVADDFRGKYREREYQLFVGYGVTERLALELEASLYTVGSLRKSSKDPSALPPNIRESGLGDVQAELRWRWRTETASRPEWFSYWETDFPFQRNRKILIGTQSWDHVLGVGATKGYRIGTFTVRTSLEYDGQDHNVSFSEYALEYLKRLSPTWRVYAGIEGEQDEVAFVTEAQIHLGSHAYLKLNNAVGLTSMAPSWAPEVGIMLVF
jgi:hypothetical protein